MLTCLALVNSLDLLSVVDSWISRHISDKTNHLAVDGKAIKASLEKCFGGTHPPYILNSFDVETGAVHIQIAIGKKTNELGEMKNLFNLINLEGVTVTIDAAGTNTDVIKAVTGDGGHVILPVKDNQKHLYEAIRSFVNDALLYQSEIVSEYDDADNGVHKHGRIDCRHYYLISEGVDELLKDTPFEGLCHSVGMVVRIRQVLHRNPETNVETLERSIQTVYYISDWDATLSAQAFAKYVRDHWAGCEMIHYVLDTELDEDLSRIRTGNGMQNYALMRKLIVAMLKWVKRQTHTTQGYHAIRMTFRDTGGLILAVNVCVPTHKSETMIS